MTKTRNNQKVKQYDFDFELLYTIKVKGLHKFNEIKNEMKFKGSFSTLSNHLAQLVDTGIIRKEFVNSRPQYYSSHNADYLESDKGLIGKLNEKIKNIVKESKDIPDKELLKEFVEDTQDLLIILSQLNMLQLNLIPNKLENHTKQILGINEKKIELINKLISLRMKILEDRDIELFTSFFELIQNNLQNFLSQNTKN